MSGLVKRILGFNALVAIKLHLYLSHVRRWYTIAVSLPGKYAH